MRSGHGDSAILTSARELMNRRGGKSRFCLAHRRRIRRFKNQKGRRLIISRPPFFLLIDSEVQVRT
jgi:hypothetical protein